MAAAAAASHGPQLTKESINPNVLNAQYAVRGELVIQADQFNSQLQKAKAEGKPHGLPFNELVYCNIGNPQQLKQKPLTFFREVLALTTYPDLIETARAAFAPDAIERAKTILASMPGGSGAYSHSAGVEKIRQDVAKFIEERDGFPSDPNDIFLTNGASPAIQNVLSMIIRGKGDGVLIPIPQYPLYTASIALFGGTAVEYELDEDNGWALRAADLEAAIAKAKSNGVNPRALVIINPGNPTGQCLDVANMREVVQVCARHNVVLLADEVYQENVYDKVNKPFHSFKKVLRQCTPDVANKVELFSFHSVSKGFIGECGRRGGYMECANINAEVKAQLYKLASISLCPNLDGQIIVDLMVRPPREGDHSWQKYKAERDAIYESLKRRAQLVAKSLNELEGVKCNSAEGAMYLFPRITLGPKAIAAAKEAAKQPDMFYCLNLLRETGLVVVPGSGFGQKAGTYHFRTTFLPPEDQVAAVSERLAKFHKKWVETYPLK